MSLKLPEIADEEKTPQVRLLLDMITWQAAEIQLLKDEIARLKHLPARPKLKPSTTGVLDQAERQKTKGGSKKKSARRKRGKTL